MSQKAASEKTHFTSRGSDGLGAVSWALSILTNRQMSKAALFLTAFFSIFSLLLVDANAQSNSASPLGTNVGVTGAGSSEQPLLNIFKFNTGWAGNIAGGGRAGPETIKSVFDLDADGWPKSFNGVGANAGKTYTEIDTNVLLQLGTHNPNGTITGNFYRPGTYISLYEGTGSLSYSGDAVKVSGTPGRDVLKVTTPSAAGIQIMMTSTDPNHTGDYIRNIRLVYKDSAYDGESLLTAGEVFNPDFLARITFNKTLRFLNWASTDSDNNGSWSARRQPTYFSWSGSVPIEVMVALANKIGADAWFTMPIMSDDDYVTRYATLVHSGGTDTSGRFWPGLNSNLKAYVEYGNEMWQDNKSWRTTFPTLPNLGWAAFPCAQNDYNAVFIYSILRAVQNGATWKSVWGADAGRVTRLLAGQAAYQGRNQFILGFTAGQYCGDTSKFAGTAAANVDAFTTAPYFAYPVPNTFTLDQFFTEMMSGGLVPAANGGYPGGMIKQALDWAAQNYADAKKYNLPLLAYEGGQHFVDYSHTDPTLQALYQAANHDPRMGTAYTTYLNGWKSAGGTLFVNYANIGYDSTWGFWGALENVLETNSAKYDALGNFSSANPCWWSGCSTTSGPSTPTTPPTSTVDTTPPSVPTGLTGTAVSTSQVNLSWTASTDNVAVAGYKVFRNGTQVGTASNTSYQDTGLSAATATYAVSAYDAAGNTSGQSSSVSVATLATAPAVMINTPTNGSTPNGSINIAVSANSAVGIASLSITADGGALATCTNVTSCSTTWQKKKISKGTHTIRGTAVDLNGSAASASVTVTIVR